MAAWLLSERLYKLTQRRRGAKENSAKWLAISNPSAAWLLSEKIEKFHAEARRQRLFKKGLF